ncbi:hypothetical protein AAFO92_17975 [Roseovarius sp. CAU 1744]|uniref:hypothetical protein n=1 Tax=Roseovarius sp. CAU 1744 TaxID=3140368 RepID=UPI00325A6C78
MTGQDGVDTRQPSQRQRRVFLHGVMVVAVDAAMGQGDDDVCPRLTDTRHPRTGRFDDIAGGQAVLEMIVVPCGDLRRQQRDHPDAQIMGTAPVIDDAPVQDQKWRQQCLVLGWTRALFDHGIGAGGREGGLCQRLLQPVNAEIELVIADPRRIIAQVIHGRDHRMRA